MNQSENVITSIEARKPYTKPEVVCELDLETRAGSGDPGDLFPDPLGLGED